MNVEQELKRRRQEQARRADHQDRREERAAKKRKQIGDVYRLQPAMRRPLVFGDPEQLKVLRSWRGELETIDRDLEERQNEGELRRFEVRYTVTEERTTVVEAETSEDAEDEVYEQEVEADEVDVLSVREMQPLPSQMFEAKPLRGGTR